MAPPPSRRQTPRLTIEESKENQIFPFSVKKEMARETENTNTVFDSGCLRSQLRSHMKTFH